VVDAAGKVGAARLHRRPAHGRRVRGGEGWRTGHNARTDPVTAQVARSTADCKPGRPGPARTPSPAGGWLRGQRQPGLGQPDRRGRRRDKAGRPHVDEMVMREKAGLKSAIGENHQASHGERKETPSTRWARRGDPRRAVPRRTPAKLAAHREGSAPVERDLKLEAMGRVAAAGSRSPLAGSTATGRRHRDAMRIFGQGVRLQPGDSTRNRAYLLADQIRGPGPSVIIGPLFTSRSKVELRNRSLANTGRLAAAGVTIAIHRTHGGTDPFLIHRFHPGGQGGPGPSDRAARGAHSPARIIGLRQDRIGSGP